MKITVEFDLSTEQGRSDYEDFNNMKRNARFWGEIYDEVFRKVIKYEQDPEMAAQFSDVWCEIDAFMKELEE